MWPFKPTPNTEQPAARTASPALQDVWSLLDPKHCGYRPTLAELERSYEESGLVYACINEIAQTASTAEITAPLIIKTLLEHPNQTQDFAGFLGQLLAAYYTTGVAHVVKLPVGSAAVQELAVLKTSCITYERGPFGKPYLRMRYDDGYNAFTLTPDNLITYLSPGSVDAVTPLSPIGTVWDDIVVDRQRAAFLREALRRLPYLVGVAETDEETTKTQRDQLQTSLKAIIGGDVLVLPRGAHLKSDAMPDDFAMPGIATRSESRVSAALNVPAILVGFEAGLERSTFANYEEARKSFRTETIAPLLSQLSGIFTRGLGAEVTFELPEEEELEEAVAVQPVAGQENSDGPVE